jgi:hypothetical protein
MFSNSVNYILNYNGVKRKFIQEGASPFVLTPVDDYLKYSISHTIFGKKTLGFPIIIYAISLFRLKDILIKELFTRVFKESLFYD